MKFCPLRDLKNYIAELTTDDSGRPSLAKTILFWGMICSSLFCWKLIIMGGFTPEFFGIFMVGITGSHGLSKYLDTKSLNTDSTEK